MAKWRNGQVVQWLGGGMVRWRYCHLEDLPDERDAMLKNGYLEEWLSWRMVRSWSGGRIVRRRHGSTVEWPGVEMARMRFVLVEEWSGGEITRLSNDQMEEWPIGAVEKLCGLISRWRNGQVEEWPDVILARWRNGQVDGRAQRDSIRSQIFHSKGTAHYITKYETFPTKYGIVCPSKRTFVNSRGRA